MSRAERVPTIADEAPLTFADVVREHWIGVFRFLLHLAGNEHDAEELTQEAFLRAWQAWDRFQPDTRPKPWMLQIARNAYTDLHRRRRKLRSRSLSEDQPSSQRDPGRNLEVIEESARIRVALQDLSELTRSVFLLRVEGEMSFAEIGAALKTSEESARWHMHQARAKLMARLGRSE